MSKHLVAVYGSLRRSMGNHRVLDGAKFIRDDIILGMGMVSFGPYPACDFVSSSDVTDYEHSHDTGITVELYEVDDNGARRLDSLEGCDPYDPESPANYYSRRQVSTKSGEVVWVYFIPDVLDEGHDPVISGDWVTYLNTARMSA